MKQASVVGMFAECAEKYGTVFWDGVELAITQDPYPDVTDDGDGCFFASAMDRDGNLWMVRWDILPDIDLEDADYCDQCDWDHPADAEMTWEEYYLD